MKRIHYLFVMLCLSTFAFAQHFEESAEIIDPKLENAKQFLKDDNVQFSPLKIIHRIPSPSSSTGELAYDGENLWMASPGDNSIYKISPLDGSVLQEFAVDTDPRGLTFDGTDLWLADRSNKLLQKIDLLDGSVLEQFDLLNEKAAGLAWDNSNLWHVNNTQGGIIEDSIYYISATTGNIITSEKPIGTQPSGLAFDGTYLWQCENDADVIYKIDVTTFDAIDTISAPGGDFANGLTFDGEYLWVSNNDADSLYQIDITNISSSTKEVLNNVNKFIIHPNPSASGIFTFTNESAFDSGNYFVEIFNQNGQSVSKKRFDRSNTLVIELTEFSVNSYFYTVSNTSGILQSGNLIKL